jgi:hypothetical protein
VSASQGGFLSMAEKIFRGAAADGDGLHPVPGGLRCGVQPFLKGAKDSDFRIVKGQIHTDSGCAL